MFIIEDYSDMQVTIFEGEELHDEWSDHEDMANCIKTILEMDAQPFMENNGNIRTIFLWRRVNRGAIYWKIGRHHCEGEMEFLKEALEK